MLAYAAPFRRLDLQAFNFFSHPPLQQEGRLRNQFNRDCPRHLYYLTLLPQILRALLNSLKRVEALA